jgi:hypothetical protein
VTRLLVVMGSGETTPTMVTTHQRILAALGEDPRAVLVDTPYGFQENADEVTAKARGYFATSVGIHVEVASLRRADAVGAVRLEAVLAAAREADWLFAGPGSPTYLARQWRQTSLPDALRERLAARGATVFASAAAVTLGGLAVPVYEIYKAGHDPAWAPGLDLLTSIGLDAVCIPHFDNRDGGEAFDTRFCYLGERRLRALEDQLPGGTWGLGGEEHTALVLDLEAGTGRVEGRGGVTVRADGAHVVFPAGSEVGVEELRAAAAGRSRAAGRAPVPSGAEPRQTGAEGDPAGAAPPGATTADGGHAAAPASLGEALSRSTAAFDAASAEGRLLDAAETTVALEQAIRAWSTDVEEADTQDRARAELRRQVGALARIAQEGLHEHRDLVAPAVDTLLGVRERARTDRRFGDADAIRDALDAAGVEVRDTPDGVEWTYHDPLGEVLPQRRG